MESRYEDEPQECAPRTTQNHTDIPFSRWPFVIGAIVFCAVAISGGIAIGVVIDRDGASSMDKAIRGVDDGKGLSQEQSMNSPTIPPTKSGKLENSVNAPNKAPADPNYPDDHPKKGDTQNHLTPPITASTYPPTSKPASETTTSGQVDTNNPIYTMISSSLGADILANTDSPAFSSVRWMINEDPLVQTIIHDKDEVIQRFSVVATFFSLRGRTSIRHHRLMYSKKGPSSSVSHESHVSSISTNKETQRALSWEDSNWLSGLHHCDWDGISCDSNQCITKLVMSELELEGVLPQNGLLGQLSCLETLDLGDNNIHGQLPDSLYTLTNLKNLYLFKNDIGGSISDNLTNLTNIKNIYLGENKLTGTIPKDISILSNLKKLSLLKNQITGTLPLFHRKSLRYLDLGYNRLGGTLPAEYGKNNFRFLYLDHNQFVNSIPSEYGQMGNWKLQELWLNNNTLTGTSPSAFNPIWILTLQTQGNQIEVGEDICKLSVLTGLGELTQIGADCGMCDCTTLCDEDHCY